MGLVEKYFDDKTEGDTNFNCGKEQRNGLGFTVGVMDKLVGRGGRRDEIDLMEDKK